MTDSFINIEEIASNITEFYSPKIISRVNEEYVKLVKILGNSVPWHNHEKSDELFLVIEGRLKMEVEDKKSFIMEKGDLYVVKKGIEHKVSSKKECLIMLMEHKSTLHTGNKKSAITKKINAQFIR